MKFKDIDEDKVTLKIESYIDDCRSGYLTSALEAPRMKDGRHPHPISAFGYTREESLAHYYRCVKDQEFMEPDVDINERCFEKNIFMGSWPFCQGEVQLLHRKLDKAFYILGGMQQNGGQGTEFDYETDKEDCAAIALILEDINAALHCEPQKKQCIAIHRVSSGTAKCSLDKGHEGQHDLEIKFIGEIK